ncbi:MAG: hypothetical protein RIK87_23790 [Fuerstiella sp.]
MPDPWLYLQATAASAIVSAACVLAMARLQRSGQAAWFSTVCVPGIGAGLVTGIHLLSLSPAWPPANALDRFFALVIPAALVVELISGISRVAGQIAWWLRIGLAISIPRILLHGSVYLTGMDSDWPLWRTSVAMAISAALLVGIQVLLVRLSERSPGVSIPLALCLTIQSAGMTVMLAGYIKGGAAALPVVATLAATTVVLWLVRNRSDGSAVCGTAVSVLSVIVGIGVVGLFGVVFIGHFFGRLSMGSALTLLLAPLLCWVPQLPQIRPRSPLVIGLLRLVLVAIPLIVVLTLAKQTFDREMGPLLTQQFPVTAVPRRLHQ